MVKRWSRLRTELVGPDGSQIPHVLCVFGGPFPPLAVFQPCRGAERGGRPLAQERGGSGKCGWNFHWVLGRQGTPSLARRPSARLSRLLPSAWLSCLLPPVGPQPQQVVSSSAQSQDTRLGGQGYFQEAVISEMQGRPKASMKSLCFHRGPGALRVAPRHCFHGSLAVNQTAHW